MRKVTFSIGLLGILALTLGGCSGDSSTTATSPSPSVVPSPSPVVVASPTPAQPFSRPPVVPSQTFNPPAVAGLVQSTNPDERIRVLEKGRQDPFAVLPVQPIVTFSPDPNAPLTRTIPQVPSVQPPQTSPSGNQRPSRSPVARARQVASQARQAANSGSSSNSSTSQPRTTVVVRTSPRTKTTIAVRPTPIRATRTVASRAGITSTTSNAGRPGLPTLTAPPLFTPLLPKLPEPELARSVEVTGVVQIGGLPQAIIKAPNETASRYVQPGQRLSNGQVLVKRIEMNEGSAPIVILEQYGVEVARQVGDRPAGKTGTPTATLPTPLRVSTRIAPQLG